jgi:hypothetical protein
VNSENSTPVLRDSVYLTVCLFEFFYFNPQIHSRTACQLGQEYYIFTKYLYLARYIGYVILIVFLVVVYSDTTEVYERECFPHR